MSASREYTPASFPYEASGDAWPTRSEVQLEGNNMDMGEQIHGMLNIGRRIVSDEHMWSCETSRALNGMLNCIMSYRLLQVIVVC